MKKTICMALAFILVLAISMSVSALSNTKDTVHYAKDAIDAGDVHVLSSTVVDDRDIAAAADEEYTVYYGINQFSPEDIPPLTPVPVNNLCSEDGTVSRASYIRLEFPGALAGSIYSDFNENVVGAGDSATLDVQTCVWAPESNTLEIGIYNWTTAENWYVLRSGGSINNKLFTFTNLSAGPCSVYIRNHGPNALTTGYLLYNLT